MKSKKAFTIIELLAVILLLSLLMIIAIPTVMKYMKKGTESYYKSLESEIKAAGAEYVQSYRSLLPQNVHHTKVINLSELESNKYIDPVKDEKGNACIGQVVIEKIKRDSYDYHGCLKCSDYYTSDDVYCKYNDNLGRFENNELNNQYTDSGDYEIRVPQDTYTIEQTQEFISPLAEVYYKGALIKSDLEGSPNKLDTNLLGTYDIVYYYHGAKKIIKVTVIDNINPAKTQVVLKYNNEEGKDYKGEWYSGNIYVKYKATDYTTKGIKGSGIDHYEVSEDGINYVKLEEENQSDYKKLSQTEQQMIKEGNYLRYVRAVDKEGNIGEVNSYRIKVDKTKPTCSFAGESTDWQPNLNLPQAQRINSRTIIATCSDSVSDCTDQTKSKTWIETETNKTKSLSYTIIDLAGNSNTCQKTVNIYLDKQQPTITGSDIALGSQDYNFVNNVTTTCGPSGCTTVCNPSESRKTGTYEVTCTITSTVGLTANVSFMARHQYQVGTTQVKDATYCGNYSYKCNCSTRKWCDSDCCAWPYFGCQNCCAGYCVNYSKCNSYEECESCSGVNTCDVYICTDQARHADGSTTSKTDSWCYY